MPSDLAFKILHSAHRFCMFCTHLRTNINFCSIQHKVASFYNQDGEYLLFSSNWVFKQKDYIKSLQGYL